MNPDDERHFWSALDTLVKRNLDLIFLRERQTGPVYDPTKGSAGAGLTCAKCRKVQRYDRRVCGSCGYLNP